MDWTNLLRTELGMDGKSSDALLSDGLAASSSIVRSVQILLHGVLGGYGCVYRRKYV